MLQNCIQLSLTKLEEEKNSEILSTKEATATVYYYYFL